MVGACLGLHKEACCELGTENLPSLLDIGSGDHVDWNSAAWGVTSRDSRFDVIDPWIGRGVLAGSVYGSAFGCAHGTIGMIVGMILGFAVGTILGTLIAIVWAVIKRLLPNELAGTVLSKRIEYLVAIGVISVVSFVLGKGIEGIRSGFTFRFVFVPAAIGIGHVILARLPTQGAMYFGSANRFRRLLLLAFPFFVAILSTKIS
jgi:hypothetical protein